jgi:hypothetical protein
MGAATNDAYESMVVEEGISARLRFAQQSSAEGSSIYVGREKDKEGDKGRRVFC